MKLPKDELERILRDAAPSGSVVEVAYFPSGSIDVLIRRADGPVVVMQGLADGSEFGLTHDLREDAGGFNDGHPHVFTDWPSALAALVDAARC